MSNIVDIKKAQAKEAKPRHKRPSKTQYQKMQLMKTVSAVTNILKQVGDAGANGRTGENCIAWWRKGDVSVWLGMCKHGHISVTIDCEHLSDAVMYQLIGWCAFNEVEHEVV